MKKMQRKLNLVATLALLVSTSACTEQAEVAATPATDKPTLVVESSVAQTNVAQTSVAQTNFRPQATLQEIMLSVIDPNIDPIWNSISTVSTAEGVEEIRPQTDEDWLTLRNHAITLREVANLLVIPGRKVAHPEVSTSTHHTELHAEAIEALIKAQWPIFIERAHALQDAADLAVKAIDAKDVDRLEEVGGIIEHTCETCHSQFWYPDDKHPGN